AAEYRSDVACCLASDCRSCSRSASAEEDEDSMRVKRDRRQTDGLGHRTPSRRYYAVHSHPCVMGGASRAERRGWFPKNSRPIVRSTRAGDGADGPACDPWDSAAVYEFSRARAGRESEQSTRPRQILPTTRQRSWIPHGFFTGIRM